MTAGDSSASRSQAQGSDARMPDQRLIQQEVIRDFSPSKIDLDELTEAVRQLLSGEGALDVRTQRDPDLSLPRRRATHVVGGKT